ncbi:MAG: TatD family hydrolase [Pseudomonadales bacterium]|jgi:TatD DNase family protein|nr:TatD family hydrolase [Pseudomonadales bacterium]MDP6317105.1 TatD family hydrolase [Pseudomonadales bacterium]MDP7316142.1 TatD family hydrolase [Pseudomonadales bacterium]|tara:strand:- start:744 stop:1529 length:786 start_codon:yes stop_codon:yes gene_type:complete
MSLIDIGANLTHDSFAEDLDQVLASAADHQVEKMVVTGASLQGSEDALRLARSYPGLLYATAGIHPHHAEETNTESLMILRDLAHASEVKAIGEAGLDFFRNFSPKDSQIKSFESHIELAIETGLPMFLHERDSHPTFRDVLKPHRDKLGSIVVHCFTGEAEALYAYLDLDCYIGITGWICDERRGAHLVPLVREIPKDRLMIETDAPYLMPRTISPKPKSRRNEPQYLTYVCEFIANCVDESFESVAQRTKHNAERFFSI